MNQFDNGESLCSLEDNNRLYSSFKYDGKGVEYLKLNKIVEKF